MQNQIIRINTVSIGSLKGIKFTFYYPKYYERKSCDTQLFPDMRGYGRTHQYKSQRKFE